MAANFFTSCDYYFLVLQSRVPKAIIKDNWVANCMWTDNFLMQGQIVINLCTHNECLGSVPTYNCFNSIYPLPVNKLYYQKDNGNIYCRLTD
jgi:hypothetical protein